MLHSSGGVLRLTSGVGCLPNITHCAKTEKLHFGLIRSEGMLAESPTLAFGCFSFFLSFNNHSFVLCDSVNVFLPSELWISRAPSELPLDSVVFSDQCPLYPVTDIRWTVSPRQSRSHAKFFLTFGNWLHVTLRDVRIFHNKTLIDALPEFCRRHILILPWFCCFHAFVL